VFPDRRIEVGPGPWEGVVEGGREFDMHVVHPAVMPPQDITRAQQELGYNPEWDIRRGVADWFRWFETGQYGD
jgi:nucleoside-diphosphate-sugar epimerase